METRVAVMSIIVEAGDMVETLNAILHDYGEYIIGRMGIPYRQRGSISSASPSTRLRIPSLPCPARWASSRGSVSRRPSPT